MDLAYIVFLVGVAIAVVAIAGYLIAITLILKHVVNRLNTILGAVQAVTKTAQPVDALIGDINTDLDTGRRLIEDCVARLEDSRVPVGATSEPARHAADRHPSDAPDGGTGGTATAAPPAPSGTEPPPRSAEEWPPRERPSSSPSPPPSPLWNT